jgi:hypothetical protein
MRVNRKGVTRLVIELERVVIKIPNFTCQWNHFLIGLLANIKENTAWKTSKLRDEGDLSYMLCPVKWCSWGGWVLVMEKAVPCDDGEEIDYMQWIYVDYGGDDKPCNYGWLDGILVKLDYGQ